jgi:uncharacterized protein YndB with AHSA1/START domain
VDFDLAVTIRRPPAVVFALLLDVGDYGDRSPSALVPVMEKIPSGPTRPGTLWHEVVRIGPGMRMTIWSEVLEVEPDRRLRERYWSSWMTGMLDYALDPTADGTVLHLHKTLVPKGQLRVFDRPIAAMLGPKELWRLEAIRDLLEASPPVPGAAARPGTRSNPRLA